MIKGETLSVLAIYEVNGDLTMKIGNIDFLGTVLIHGSINGEFKVKAGADVVIDGVLDGGEVVAGRQCHDQGRRHRREDARDRRGRDQRQVHPQCLR